MLSPLSLSALLLFSTTAQGQDAPEDPPTKEADEAAAEKAEAVDDASKSEAKPDEAEAERVASEDVGEEKPDGGAEGDEEGRDESGTESDAGMSPEEGASDEQVSAEQQAPEPPPAPEPVAPASNETGEDESEESAEPQATIEDIPPKPSLPGSPRPAGLGLAPEAPPVGPAPGGRAPSFGTPLGPEDAALNISGNIAAWQTAGIGRRPGVAPPTYSGTPIHVAPIIAGRAPFWRQAELSLFITYGTPVVNATVAYSAFAGGREYQGFQEAVNGATFGQAYLTLAPNPIGNLQVRAIAGAFVENYAGPGQWGWGLFGPLIGLRGYGESTHLEYTASSKMRLIAKGGFMGVPGVPEDFPRGDWNGWQETGVSTIAFHAHAGFNYASKYSLQLHYAGARGTDERVNLEEDPRDGKMDVYALEGHWWGIPWGHFGISGGLWDFHEARSVHDALWWGVKYTKGAQDMLRDYVGMTGRGTGKVAAVSAEYNMSLARIAWHPRPFDGRAPDVRISVAGIAHRTLETDDPDFEDSNGFLVGTEIEYQMLRWLSFNVRSYGENRSWLGDRWGAYNIAPGLAFRSDWQSPDRIELWYSRHFYSDIVDNNSALPLDRDVLALGVFLGF